MSDSPTLGTLIREHRLEQGLSLGQLATKLGHTSASVRRWERGEDVPSNALIVRIAEALRVDEVDLRAALAVTPAAAAPKAAEPAPGERDTPKSPAAAAASPDQEETPSPSAPDLPWEIGDEIREKPEQAEPGAAKPERTPPEPQFELEATPPQAPEPQDKDRPPPPPEVAEQEAAEQEAAQPEAKPPQAPEPGPEPEPEGGVTKAPQAPKRSDAKPALTAAPASATEPTDGVTPSQPKPAAPEVPKVPVAAAAPPGAARSDRPLDITEAPTEAVPVVPEPRRSGTVPPTPSAADGAIPARPTVERPSFQNPFAVLFDPEQPWLYWIRLALLVIVGLVLFYIFVWAVGEFWDSLGELLDTFGSTEEVSDVVPEN